MGSTDKKPKTKLVNASLFQAEKHSHEKFGDEHKEAATLLKDKHFVEEDYVESVNDNYEVSGKFFVIEEEENQD